MKRNKLSLFSIPYVVWMAIFVVIPILMVVIYAFSSAGGGFTLDNFARMGTYTVIFARSFQLAIVATVVCLLLGYPVAYILSNMRKSIAAFISVLFFVPMWMNFVLRTYAWQDILEYAIQKIGFNCSMGRKQVSC